MPTTTKALVERFLTNVVNRIRSVPMAISAQGHAAEPCESLMRPRHEQPGFRADDQADVRHFHWAGGAPQARLPSHERVVRFRAVDYPALRVVVLVMLPLP